jgi:hypothetical protein
MKRIISYIGALRNPIIYIVLALGLTFLFTSIRPGLQPVSEPYPPPPESEYPSREATWTILPLPTDFPPGYAPMINGAMLTPLPNPCEIVFDEPFITPTPLPIAKIIDLAEGIPDEEKYIFIVQRENGLYDSYILPSSEDFNTLLGLGPNDKIITDYPFAPQLRATPQLFYTSTEASPTPLIISKTIDLASDIPNKDKCVFVIQRASGVYEHILIPIDAWNVRYEWLPLEMGDVIVDAFPWIITFTPMPVESTNPWTPAETPDAREH